VLTDADIELMRETSREIKKKRERPVTVIYMDGEVDEYTGEIIGDGPVEREVSAVVTEVSSLTNSGVERYTEGGIKYEKGDIWLSIDIDLVADIADKMERIKYDGQDHMILAADKKGIGKRNRIEVLGRVTA